MSVGAGRSAIAETTIDGVRVLWTNGPPPARASLSFRVGRVDETLATAGISHLVEHLAFARVGERPYAFNATVEPLQTAFYATGTPDDLVDFLTRACTGLTHLEVSRIPVERRILRTEAAGKSAGIFGMHAAHRFGTQGPGLLGFGEVGLNRLAGPELLAFSEWFHSAENAVLTLTCPPPVELRLPLRHGTHRAVPVPRPVPFALPAWTQVDTDAPSMSFFHPRSVAASSALAMAERRLLHRLRTEAGISYGASRVVEQVGAHQMLSVLACDVLAAHEQAANDLFLQTVTDITTNGFRADELEREKALWSAQRSAPDFVIGELYRRAAELLLGNDPDEADPWAALDGLQVDETSSRFTALLGGSLYVAPHNVSVTSTARRVPDWSERVVGGDELRRMTMHAMEDAPDARMVVGGEGLTLHLDTVRRITVRWSDCTAAVTDDTGRWLLYNAEGFSLTVAPQHWIRGEVLRDALERFVAPHLRIPFAVDEPSSSPAASPTTAAPAPAAQTFTAARPFRPAIPWWRIPALSSWILVVALVPLAFLTFGSALLVLDPDLPDDRSSGAIMLAFMGPLTGWLATELVRRRRDPLPPPRELFD